MHWYKGAEWRVNMASTFFGLSISYKGLQAAQTSITTTAHNLSNINTDGYTKQSVLLQASDALRTYSTYGTIGSGVNVVEIKQTRDSYYDEKYRNNCANYGQYEAKNNYMTQVEDYLNEFLLSGFSKEYGNFFDAVNQLTITPADTSAKNQLINNAKSMTDYFNTLANNLRNVQADANNEVKDTVEHINTLAQNITALNKQINQIEACYGDANDLRDQRNALVDELSKAVNITVSETEIQNGLTSFQITINGQSLVNDYSYRTLEVVARGEVRNTSDADGLYDIKWNDGSDFNIYSDSLGGQLKALIDIRDGCNGEIESYAKNDDGTYKTDIDGNIVTETNAQAGENINYKGVPYYQVQLNTFIQTFAQAVNSIFESGYVSDADTTDAKNKGIPLFVVQDGSGVLTATTVSVNSALLEDADKLATKSNVGDGESQCDLIEQINALQKKKIFDGVVLVVDAFEGVMPQTKFVLQKALDLNLAVIVCINKIDRPEARPNEVIDEILELFIDLDASDEQLDCPFIFASAKSGYAMADLDDERKDMQPLFDCIVNNIPAPEGDPDADTQMLISTIDYNEFVGRIGVGKIENGKIKVNQEVAIVNHHDPSLRKRVRVTKLYTFNGLNKVEVNEAGFGDIVAVSGIADLKIGDTLCSVENPVAIPFQKISEPTLSMDFMVNDSPLAGKEGKFVTSRHIRDRLFKELNTDVSLRVEENPGSENSFKVSGRGELHLSVLIENMRREGYEFAVSKAEVLYHTDERGKKLEPMELAYIDVPEEFSGSVIQKLSQRKGELLGMTPINGGYTRLQFSIPSRGLIGYRGEFLTDTKGNGIINTSFEGYEEYKGDISYRKTGSLIAYEDGEAVTYGLFNAQDRGTLFIGPGEKVYAGMIIGENPRTEDIEVNVCKTKHLTNTRSSSADEALRLVPPKILSLEQALDYIDTDELLEVTPTHLRIRKKILDSTARYRANKK